MISDPWSQPSLVYIQGSPWSVGSPARIHMIGVHGDQGSKTIGIDYMSFLRMLDALQPNLSLKPIVLKSKLHRKSSKTFEFWKRCGGVSSNRTASP